MTQEAKFQIGKQGITPGVIKSLLLAFKRHKSVRISLLQASGRDKNKTKLVASSIAKQLEEKLPYTFSHAIIGFTIVLRRHSQGKKQHL